MHQLMATEVELVMNVKGLEFLALFFVKRLSVV